MSYNSCTRLVWFFHGWCWGSDYLLHFNYRNLSNSNYMSMSMTVFMNNFFFFMLFTAPESVFVFVMMSMCVNVFFRINTFDAASNENSLICGNMIVLVLMKHILLRVPGAAHISSCRHCLIWWRGACCVLLSCCRCVASCCSCCVATSCTWHITLSSHGGATHSLWRHVRHSLTGNVTHSLAGNVWNTTHSLTRHICHALTWHICHPLTWHICHPLTGHIWGTTKTNRAQSFIGKILSCLIGYISAHTFQCIIKSRCHFKDCIQENSKLKLLVSFKNFTIYPIFILVNDSFTRNKLT